MVFNIHLVMKTKKLQLTVILFLTTLCITAQPSIDWQKSFGGTGEDYGTSIQQTTDGGYIVAGYSGSTDGDVIGNHGSYDYCVLKLDSSGDITWQKSLGGSGYDYLTSIQQTSDGGYVVAGNSNSNGGDVSGSHGSYDYWVVKLTSLGDITWQKCIGGMSEDHLSSIQQTSDGGYILAGESQSNDGDVSGIHGSYDYWVVKLTSMGTIEWQKSLGGIGYDSAQSIKQTSDDGYIVAGYSGSTDGDVTGNHGGYDSWVLKLTSAGVLEWQKSLGGTGSDNAVSIQQTSNGGYIVVGYSHQIMEM